jgi:hypothetical protein
LEIGTTGSLTFEGSTADAFETTLAVVDPTADRTITIPNVTGTVVTTGDSGTITSTMIADGTIVDADVNASAAIAGTKVSPDFGSQTIATTGVFSHALGAAATPSVTFTGDLNTGIYSPGADQLAISTNSTERLRVTSTGLVGIGTTSPGYTLDVAPGSAGDAIRLRGGSGGTGVLQFTDSSASTQWGTITTTSSSLNATHSSVVKFSTASSERARIDSSGRLLVGTSTARDLGEGGTHYIQLEGTGPATSSLVLTCNSGAAASYLTLARSGGATVGSSTVVSSGDALGNIQFNGADGTDIQTTGARISAVVDGTPGANDMPCRLVFSTTADGASSPTERMRISANGQIGLKANGVNGAYFSVGGIFIDSAAWASGAGTNAVKWSSATGALTWDSSSRLVKENIESCIYGIDAIKQLQPRIYTRKDSGETEIGFIADEVQSVIPEVVPTGPKSAITGNEEDTELIPISVNYDKFVAVLTKALQEAVEKIEALEAKVAALEAS